MLRICIPVHNEATTIGVLLWRLRSVFQGFSREYDVVVYDDASTDGTNEVLEPYQSVMPLTVVRGETHRGYAASIDALVRHVAADDEYARRDAMVLLQGDFTESPEHLPELVKRFEGGADLVAVHRTTSDATPVHERRLRRWGRWAVTPFLRLPPVADPFTGFRLVRISVLRELLRALGSRPVCAGDGWAANIDFALNVSPFARRIENVEFAPRYDVRQRASRRRGWPDVVALFHWARIARRAARPAPGGKAAEPTPRPVREERLVREERPTTMRPSAASLPEDPVERVVTPVAAAQTARGTPDDSAVPAPAEKKAKRRRRRSRRGRDATPGEPQTLDAVAGGAAAGSMDAADIDDEGGTSGDGEGEEEGGDMGSSLIGAGDGTGQPVGEEARRKRRSRRRRRGRRPGGPDTVGSDRASPAAPPPPPAAEPPAA